MELRVLRYFLAVVREGTILRAAEALHITQPSLSRQLARLEEELGVGLFIRGNRKIMLTEAGLLLKRRAEEIVSLADKTEREFSALNGGGEVGGVISVGSGELSSVSELAEIIRSFRERYPNTVFNFFSGNADDIRDKIDTGLLDFLAEQGLGYAIAVNGAVAMYGGGRVCVKPLRPELVSTSVIVWKKSQPAGMAAKKFREHLSMLIGHR